MTIKTRFAPSPTGMMHVGNARTALISWLFVRKNNGKFLLRIDDTDAERSKVEYEHEIEAALTWMGLDWDEKANQKDRWDLYNVRIEELKSSGRIYACYETPEELSLKRKTQLNRGKPPIYDREGLSLTSEQKAAFEAEGRSPHWRFLLTDTPIEWDDQIRGAVKFEGSDLSDPVVLREDGTPLYHLCSVIDDIDLNITHILRGEDHVSNTATHVQMFEALGATPPTFAHMSLISDADGGKLSKRLGSMNLRDLREDEGLEAMSINSLLARLGTSDPIESYGEIAPLIESFDFSKFSRGTPKFDMDELFRLNAKILHDMDFAVAQPKLAAIGLDNVDEKFWIAVRANLEKLSDIKDWWHVAKEDITPVIEDEDADYIATALTLLPAAPWNENSWNEWVNAVKEATGRKGKGLFMPLRQALTGMGHGPEMPVMFQLIGPELTRARLTSK